MNDEIAGDLPAHAQQPGQSSTCLIPMWDGPYRYRCSMGVEGICGRHGPHQPHPDNGKPCKVNPHDGFCHQHAVYVRNPPERPTSPGSEVDRG